MADDWRPQGGSLFEGQGLHLAALASLIAVLTWVTLAFPSLRQGRAWLAAGVAAAVAHQVWVLVWWRLELHLRAVSRRLGAAGFRIFGAGFVLLALVRFATVVGAGLATPSSVAIPRAVAWPVAALLGVPVVWLLHSIARHFGFARALGGDHFFQAHREAGLCSAGIFRYVPNAMYTVGFLAPWAVGIACASSPALLLAAFNHAYIWVHYFATEKPDMDRIYR
jgi:hypothetical protein